MQAPLVLAGQYGSPYTLKMRCVLRYRQIPFQWMVECDGYTALGGHDRNRVDAVLDGTGCKQLFG